ncbi:hypothetical protein Snas_4383 [Stackebrandtia nassauensis DSM 44728]|uniref:Uncharacterized protein n=1 Tax=Stackebrandtia nassauensis (strain DSM 44728 / CIP 108903 / NRRL B-16338 / NBRC 102104 / LLR-40K-21) TaxID=446470 RepID=D3Q3W3_STANL|nr:hypothetical protein Snas_4383 [Stackebrandtia nassauensis DSM 44728]
MYRPNEPHGVATTTVPTARKRNRLFGSFTRPAIKTGVKKLELMNEALARVRMREIWRPEHRHRRRYADVLRDVKRRRHDYR